MVSANEARAITNEARLKNYIPMINSAVFASAKHGKSTAEFLFPEDIANAAAMYLEKHGFRVVEKRGISGILVTAAW